VEEVRLWKVVQQTSSKAKVEPVGKVDSMTTEKLLEELLVQSPEVLLEGLTIIGRQNETANGPLDLLGVDGDGRLVVFELKRGQLSRDAVAQVLDYASWIASLDPEELNDHVVETSGRYGAQKIENLADWYRTTFGAKSLLEIGRPRMILVGLGVEDGTKRMVEFLSSAEVDISLITFYGFVENGQTLLARHVEIEDRATKETNKYRDTKAANEKKFGQTLQQQGLKSYFDKLLRALSSGLGDRASAFPNASGYSFMFADRSEAGNLSTRVYVGLGIPEGRPRRITVTLQPRAAMLVGNDSINGFAVRLGAKTVNQPSGLVELILDPDRPIAGIDEAMCELGTTIAKGRASPEQGTSMSAVA
jgi:hypothetical protein